MTENQPPKDENSQETMNSGKLETVQNIDLDKPSPTDSINALDDRETAMPSNSSKKAKTIKDDSRPASFRVSQALYKTILTNLHVILVVFVVGLIGWVAWYLSPLTASNTTYNAEANENAVSLVVDNLGAYLARAHTMSLLHRGGVVRSTWQYRQLCRHLSLAAASRHSLNTP